MAGKWTYFLFVCYLGWSLEKVKIVNCTVTNYEYRNVCSDYGHFENVCSRNNSWNVLHQSVSVTEEIRNSNSTNSHLQKSAAELTRVNGNFKTLEDLVPFTVVNNLMSQFHLLLSHKTKNELCKNHIQVLWERAQNFDTWALKMLDSSAKLPSGILNGNVNQYGDFDQCLNINVDIDSQLLPDTQNQLKGKYCLALINLDLRNSTLKKLDNLMFSYRHVSGRVNDTGHRIARFTPVNWGFCIPSSCDAEDLAQSLEESLQMNLKDTGITFTHKVDPNLCYVKDPTPVSLGTKLTITFFISLLVLVLLGTWISNKEKSIFKGKALSILKAFSLQKNVKTLLHTDESSSDIAYIHGIRAINAFALVVFHKSVALTFRPFINRTNMIETYGMGWSVIGRTAIVYTDTFILISGLLTSYNILRELDRKKKINVLQKYLFRYIRFTPNMLAIILFCTYILTHLGSGPQWNLVVKHHSDMCQENMWKNLLYIHNYFGFETMCLTHTHQLAIDMQLYVIAPIFIFLLWKNHKLGLAIASIIIFLSTILRFVVTYSKNLSTVIFFGASVSQLFATANLSYTMPTHRASVYFIGILIGYMLQQKKPSVTLNKAQVLMGWTISISLGLFDMFGPYHMSSPDYQYNPMDASLYNAFSPLIWGCFIGLGIFLTLNGYGGYLEGFLSWRGFKVFSNISYAVYLTQFPIFFYNVGMQRVPQYYTPSLLFEVGEVIAIIISSIALTLLVDLPCQELRKYFWSEGTQKMNLREEQNEILGNQKLNVEEESRNKKCKRG